ncbi:uncharacterized protein [Parasteatoda tepidariorum]|uniref:uncharacterized protein n=1 Tax=Parasteatoda tepidariorum TaxID=114398 RepID=UPI00077FD6F2|nr:uncharacterized protein LOC107445161 [Parasteatoda tepidariorum]XP_015914990.1 uncharacterized protein LOC107445161 [Parasteatoda tepidariorum]
MALAKPADDPIHIESGVKIKKEKEDEEDTVKTKNPSDVKKFIVSDPQLSGLQSRNITITVASSSQKEKPISSIKLTLPTPKKPSVDNIVISKPSSPPPADYTSRCKAFGWSTVGSINLPYIMRSEHKFVAARILEDKVIRAAMNILPGHLFKFAHVESFYMTEAEITLYNEINEFHCDLQFGYPKFTSSDVVVSLEDCISYYDFLETCKAKLDIQGNRLYNDQCGFYSIRNDCVPYIKKGTKKYIPLNGVPVELMPSVTRIENVTEWDIAYFRLLYGKSLADSLQIQQICCVEDLENALGGIRFEEFWADLRCLHASHLPSSNDNLSKWEDSVIQSPVAVENAKKLREKISEMQEKESMLSSFLGLDKYLNVNSALSRATHLTQSPELQNGLGSITNSDKTNMFPMSIENLLVTSSNCNYPYSINYSNQYNSHLQHPSVSDLERYRKLEENMPSLTSNRPRPFPPPPPLVRLGGSHAGSAPTENAVVPKTTPSIYPYIPTPANPWLSRFLEPDWIREEERVVLQQKDTPENLSRRYSENDLWCPTSLSSSSVNLNGAGSSNLVRSNSNPAGVIRDGYDITSSSLCRDDRILHPHGGSPRLLAGPGPPPHYPTPPQSSPLQPLSLMDCTPATIVPDIYSTRNTPNGLDLCSPPPSPEMRTALSSSPRGPLLSSYPYHPHIARLVQVDTRYVLAINIEPLKYSSLLAVPLSDVVNKFLRGSSVQSCQIVLETYGIQLYECTSLQHEAFAKHNVSVPPGSKLILLTDLKNYIQQLKIMMLDREKQKEMNCDFTTSESPLSKRWCNNAREC